MGHATAADMLTPLKNGMALLNPSSLVLIFISMDGPNVNRKFYHNLFQERKGEELPNLPNVGSCSLHFVYVSFKKVAKESGWNLGILCVLCGKFLIILLPEGKILFKLQAVICFPFDFISIDG